MEQIGLKGILEGIHNMLVTDEKDTLELARVKMSCAKNMLKGVIVELTPIPIKPAEGSVIIDHEAKKAKEELI